MGSFIANGNADEHRLRPSAAHAGAPQPRPEQQRSGTRSCRNCSCCAERRAALRSCSCCSLLRPINDTDRDENSVVKTALSARAKVVQL